MHHLTAQDFPAYFRDVHGCAPYPWQQRLTTQVLANREWPSVIDLPTGAGKTAVLDTALFAMAVQPQVWPRRIVFVVDRRIVVDQVCERAKCIRDRVRAGETSLLREIDQRLRALCGGKLLGVASLRGGIPIDDQWAERPDRPWVLVSTVDQFGSRLLFRAYGVSKRMRPVHAGLAGNDCLVILDEVHLSIPFAQTLSHVAELPSPLPRRFHVVEMSATPNNQDAIRFELDGADRDDPHLGRRLRAEKLASLVSVPKREAIPSAVLKIVKSIAESPHGLFDQEGGSIGVIVNRVRTARETFQALEGAGFTTYLLTGRMRPLDRAEVLDRVRIAAAPGRLPSKVLSLVVATQAIEVGADFSFDALVTECAPVDSLRQRFGRLDRDGAGFERSGRPACAWILGPASAISAKKPDSIYGHAVKAAWETLQHLAEAGPVDVGVDSLRGFPDTASAPKDHAPLLLKTHLDAWTQTNPEPIVQPDVVHFLHGTQAVAVPDVFVVWRWDRSTETLRLVPPRQAEFLSVPIDAAKAWLLGDDEVDVADVRQTEDAAGNMALSSSSPADWVRWAGHDSGVEDISAADVAPGDIIVVDPTGGGLTAGTWDPCATNAVEDLGDAAQLAYGRRATLRLDARLPYVETPPTPRDASDVDASPDERIRDWLQELEAGGTLPDWLDDAIKRLHHKPVIDVASDGEHYILTERNRQTDRPAVDVAVMDGSDETSSMIGSGVTLRRHMDGVGSRAECIGRRLGLPASIVADLELAGRLHDLGKVDMRFQAQLVGGDVVDLAMRDEPLAKSLPDVRWHSGTYPRGMRHEMASVALVESSEDVLDLASDRDLVLHLVGTHHGFGRPLPAIVEDDEPQVLGYTFDGHALSANSDLSIGTQALDMADRFWRLTERYGCHGLAWLEAILRLADHQQSAEEAHQ